MLLVFGAPCQHSLLAGREHGRTIPLGDHDNIGRDVDVKERRATLELVIMRGADLAQP